jgi:hypothetical protein
MDRARLGNHRGPRKAFNVLKVQIRVDSVTRKWWVRGPGPARPVASRSSTVKPVPGRIGYTVTKFKPASSEVVGAEDAEVGDTSCQLEVLTEKLHLLKKSGSA